jgi:hypothetical protein
MGNLKGFLTARADGTADMHVVELLQRYSSRLLDFPGFGRHLIVSTEADMVRDMQNHVSSCNHGQKQNASYLFIL